MIDCNSIKRITVKVGSSTLTHSSGKLNLKRLESLARVLSDVQNKGIQVVLVTSGAISLGVNRLGLKKKPADMPEKQAAAAIGQSELMCVYDKLFSEYGYVVGQVLLTRDVVENENRKNNVINTFNTLLKYNTIPIVNENDTVSVEEIVFGDNDTLSAVVADLTSSDLLIILTDTDGLYDKNPREFSDAKLIPVVREIDDNMRKNAGGAGTENGTGGMAAKLIAAELATSNKINMVIVNGKNPEIIYDILEGKQAGTVFLAKE